MAEYKQPHEGISGIDRSADDLLSLDARAMAHRDALITMTKHLRDATLVGNPAPVVARMSTRIRAPRVGDLVVEATAFYRRRDLDSRVKAFGFLVEKRKEWWLTDEDWAAAKIEDDSLTDADRMTDEAWYVQYGPDPADICRWVNCDFTVVPIDRETFMEQFGTRTDGGGVTVTRDDLLGSLADAGFQLRT